MDEIIKSFKDEIASTNSSRHVLSLLLHLKYETIMWFKDKGWSDRSIANKVGLSNSRVSKIIKTIQSK